MRRLMNFLRGMVILRLTGPFPERLINLCAQEGIDFWAMEWLDKNTVRLTTRRRTLGWLQELAQRAGRVVSVELDKALPPILAETLADCPNAQVVSGDILKTDIPALIQERAPGLVPIACANLPYNITTPAITALIESGCFASITVMIQREVARRICAAPGAADYGAFSVYCQYHTSPEILFEVPPDCFVPAPKVTSAVVRMVPRPAPEEVDDPKHFFRVVKGAFAQRRKTLLNSLASVFGGQTSREALLQAIERCGLPADIRGERLSIPQFAQLSKALRGLV